MAIVDLSKAFDTIPHKKININFNTSDRQGTLTFKVKLIH